MRALCRGVGDIRFDEVPGQKIPGPTRRRPHGRLCDPRHRCTSLRNITLSRRREP
jgi:hypothetical protein